MTENLSYISGRPHLDIPEIKFRKRKRVRHIEDGGSSRSHKDDEKARRNQIAHQFAKLRQLISNGASLRARQEVLQKVRTTIWELKRDHTIETLYRRNELDQRVKEIQEEIVLKQEELAKLQSLISDDSMDSSQAELTELLDAMTESSCTEDKEKRRSGLEEISFKTCRLVGEDSPESEQDICRKDINSMIEAGVGTVLSTQHDAPSEESKSFHEAIPKLAQEIPESQQEPDLFTEEGQKFKELEEASVNSELYYQLITEEYLKQHGISKCKAENIEIDDACTSQQLISHHLYGEDVKPDINSKIYEAFTGKEYSEEGNQEKDLSSIDLQSLLSMPNSVSTQLISTPDAINTLPQFTTQEHSITYPYFTYPFYYQPTYFTSSALSDKFPYNNISQIQQSPQLLLPRSPQASNSKSPLISVVGSSACGSWSDEKSLVPSKRRRISSMKNKLNEAYIIEDSLVTPENSGGFEEVLSGDTD